MCPRFFGGSLLCGANRTSLQLWLACGTVNLLPVKRVLRKEITVQECDASKATFITNAGYQMPFELKITIWP